MAQILVALDMGTLLEKFDVNKRFVNKAVNTALEKSAGPLQRSIRSKAPRRTGHLARSLKVVLKKGAGGSAKLSKLLVTVAPGSEAEKYWLTREFGPRGGVIRGRPVLAFTFPGSPLFGQNVSASEVRANPTAYGFDYTMRFENVVYGVIRKSGKTWEQLYPGAKRRVFRSSASKLRTPPVSKWFVPLFIVLKEVKQEGTGYITRSLDQETPKIMRRIARAITNRFNQ